MTGTRWIIPQHERTLDGHSVAVGRRHGQATVDRVAIQTCDLVADNGIVHAVDSFLPSALRRHLPGGRRHRQRHLSDIWALMEMLGD